MTIDRLRLCVVAVGLVKDALKRITMELVQLQV